MVEGPEQQKPRGGNGAPGGTSQGCGDPQSLGAGVGAQVLDEPQEGRAGRSWSPPCCSVRALVYSGRPVSVYSEDALETILGPPWQRHRRLGRGTGGPLFVPTAPCAPPPSGAGARVK